MTREDIKKQVIETICKILDISSVGLKKEDINESTRFVYDLGADSLDMVEILMDFERVFCIKSHDEEINTTVTVGEAIDTIAKKLGLSSDVEETDVKKQEVPYKIYINDNSTPKVCSPQYIDFYGVEYMRKDLVLKLLKELLKEQKETIVNKILSNTNELINKL